MFVYNPLGVDIISIKKHPHGTEIVNNGKQIKPEDSDGIFCPLIDTNTMELTYSSELIVDSIKYKRKKNGKYFLIAQINSNPKIHKPKLVTRLED